MEMHQNMAGIFLQNIYSQTSFNKDEMDY